MLVRIYRNLHTKTLSMQSKVNGKWKVIGHPTSVSLNNVRFLVYQSGRNRVLREKKKNVHAYIEGTLEFSNHSELMPSGARFSYNPYKMDSFYLVDSGEPVKTADWVEIHSNHERTIMRGKM